MLDSDNAEQRCGLLERIESMVDVPWGVRARLPTVECRDGRVRARGHVYIPRRTLRCCSYQLMIPSLFN